MIGRAFAILDVKAMDETERTLRGIATTPSVDRIGDVIEPHGVQFQNPMPFLWQHDAERPIGLATFSDPTDKGIRFEASIPQIPEPGLLADRIEEAWQAIKYGLVRAVSIGFRALEYAFTETGIRYDQIEVFELSAVTIPANSEALITSVKSIDAALRAAAGLPDPEIPQRPIPEGALARKSRIVRLGSPAGAPAPFVIRQIRRG